MRIASLNQRESGDRRWRGLRFWPLFLAAVCCLGGRAVMAGGGGENMLLVVDPNDPSSLQIANAYAALRDIPSNNIVYIAPPSYYQNDGAPIAQADVTNLYLTPIAAAISARGLTGQINYIGTIGGPTSYSVTPLGSLFATNANSLNYALSLLTPLTNGSGLTLDKGVFANSALYQDPGNIPIGDNPAISHSNTYNATFYNRPGTKTLNVQYYMSGTIGYTGSGGNTAAQVIASLQSAVSSDGTRPGGTIYFEDNGDVRSQTRDWEWSTTESQLTTRKIPWVYENNTSGATPQNRNNVSGAVTGLANLSLPNGSTYLPGSWADNLTSYGCDFQDTGQSKATAFIAAGAAGTCGSVVEPYAISSRFTNSSIYTFIADGSTLGEAFAKSVQTPDIQMPLGDILCQPYADLPKVAVTSGPVAYATVNGAISIAASAGLASPVIATGIASLQLAVDGLLSSSGTVSGSHGSFTLNTATLSDGVHEVRVVGVNNAQAASEGYTAEEILVNNHGRSINFNGGNLTLVSSPATINVAAAAGDGTVSQIELTCLGRVVATAAGSAGTISLSPTTFAAGTTTVVPNLAPGDNTIVPVAIYSDGMQVAGGAFVMHVETGPISTWANGGGTKLWSNPANWSGGALPQNADNVARFGGGTSGGTVTLDASAAVQEIDFDNTGGGNYVIAAAPGQAITLSTTNGVASECLINVNSGNHTISAPLVLATPGNLFTTTNPTDSLTLSGSISGIGSLTKTGSGTLILAAANTYSGVTTITSGTLQLGNASALGAGPVALGARGVLDLNAQGTTINGLSGVAGSIITSSSAYGSTVTLTAGGASNSTYSGVIQNGSGYVALKYNGTGILTLNGVNTYTGSVGAPATTISSGTVQVGNSSALGTGNVSDSGALDLNGNNLNIGSLTGAGKVTNNASGTSMLTLNENTSGIFSGSIQDGGSGGHTALTVSGSALLTLSGASNTYTGSTTVSGTSSRLTIYAPFNTSSFLDNGALSIRTSSPFIYAGPLSGPGTFTKAGASQLTLTGPNSYSGGTTITAGTLQAGSSTALGTGSVAVNSTLDLNGQSLTIGNLSGAGGLITSNSANTSSMLITSGTSAGNSTTFAGWIQDGASAAKVGLTMNGPGMLTLSNQYNTYSGGTTVNNGTLVAANATGSATGSGNVTMNGGTLASATSGGSISGKVLAGSGTYTIAPGGVGKIGSMNVGGITTASNLTVLDFDLTTPGGSGDLLLIGSGGLTLAPHTVIVFGTDPTATGDYRLIGGNFGTPALSNFDLPAAPLGESYSLSTTVDSGYIDLVVQPVPEPSTLALLGAAAMGLVVLAWRRRRPAA